jgi:16S rRNA (adenine1518-N6/adenine1519-N6)-dimethyltransferase
VGVPRKRFGQHFLSDPRILARIADAVGATRNDTVLEIGPGPGGLTAALLERAGRVVAIEKDRDLAERLRRQLPALELVVGDAMDEDWHALGGPGALVAGNIPYNITSPLLDKALMPPRPRRVVFLVQKEVADRVSAAPGSEAYGALSVGVQAVATGERLFVVPAGAFMPRPKVDSAVLRLTPLATPLVPDALIGSFRRVVVGLFSFRRKQLARGLRELTGYSPERAQALLDAAGVEPTVRPEVLDPASFYRLTRALVDAGWSPGADL